MDSSPRPPRRFSRWQTTKRTFKFGEIAINNNCSDATKISQPTKGDNGIVKNRNCGSSPVNLKPDAISPPKEQQAAQNAACTNGNLSDTSVRSADSQSIKNKSLEQRTCYVALGSKCSLVKPTETQKEKTNTVTEKSNVPPSDIEKSTPQSSVSKDQPSINSVHSASNSSHENNTSAKEPKKVKRRLIVTEDYSQNSATDKENKADSQPFSPFKKSRLADTSKVKNVSNISDEAATPDISVTGNSRQSFLRDRSLLTPAEKLMKNRQYPYSVSRSKGKTIQEKKTTKQKTIKDNLVKLPSTSKQEMKSKNNHQVDKSDKKVVGKDDTLQIQDVLAADSKNNHDASTNHSEKNRSYKNSPPHLPNGTEKQDTVGRRGLRDRSLLPTPESVQQHRQYPMEFYFSAKQLSDHSSSTISNASLKKTPPHTEPPSKVKVKTKNKKPEENDKQATVGKKVPTPSHSVSVNKHSETDGEENLEFMNYDHKKFSSRKTKRGSMESDFNSDKDDKVNKKINKKSPELSLDTNSFNGGPSKQKMGAKHKSSVTALIPSHVRQCSLSTSNSKHTSQTETFGKKKSFSHDKVATNKRKVASSSSDVTSDSNCDSMDDEIQPTLHDKPPTQLSLNHPRTSSNLPVCKTKAAHRQKSSVVIDKLHILSVAPSHGKKKLKAVKEQSKGKKTKSVTPVPLLAVSRSETCHNDTIVGTKKIIRKRNLYSEMEQLEESYSSSSDDERGKDKMVRLWCPGDHHRRGTDITAYDVVLQAVMDTEDLLCKQETLARQRVIQKVMRGFKSSIRTKISKLVQMKELQKTIQQKKKACNKLMSSLAEQNKKKAELQKIIRSMTDNGKDVNMLKIDFWMKGYSQAIAGVDMSS
ncbi:uncharacterized protein LOC131953279 [Physella acuta]|uniref:uncharacterized protein LOC131953279 n=1 Tax=Physella acuta TaxID=109671 RepID=UPI0027DC6CDF|nr:uncharacterized protein LOC131953279 [Physella acuta]XP_059172381.1 uncharacterized protein LOC131953279 [Physella acuta]XP_059172382.1 uncharacterized protein LOC131953279 [Physella acuta]XP_059172383.1 uncharacterized protein LOC131953279 [Physella acuta]